MKTKIQNLYSALAALAVCSTLGPQLSTSLAQGTTAFTYNGRLSHSGGVPNGNYLIYFAMFPTNFGGPLLFGITNTVAVSNGLFTVTLDFGSGIFDGAARWLELGVSTNGPAAFTTLQPRQQITPTPYAIMASKAATVSGGAIQSAHIAGGQVVKSLNGMRDDVTLLAGTNITLTAFPNSNLMISASGAGSGDSVWSLNGSSAYYNGGKVGIGTTSPAYALDVTGQVRAGGAYLAPWGPILTVPAGPNTNLLTMRWDGINGDRVDLEVPGANTNSARFSFTSTGKFGVGTASPAMSLDVNGTFGLFGAGLNGSTFQRLAMYADSTNGILFEAPRDGGGNKLAYHFNWRGGGPDAITILGNGNVGIGTGSPSAPLHIANRPQSYARIVSTDTLNGSVLDLWNTTPYGPDLPDPNFGAINFSDGVNFPGQIAYNVGTGFTFRSGGVNAMFIATGPFVGIGRKPALNNLEVEGSASKSFAGSWLANSDRRIKRDIAPVTSALDRLERVRLVRFRYADEYRAAHPGVEDREYLNVIAQEFREVFPEHVKGSGEKLSDGSEILQVDTYPLTIYSAAAIQELDRKLEQKETEITELKQRMEKLEQLLERKLDGGAK